MSAMVTNAVSLCSPVGLASDDQQYQINYEHEVYGKKILATDLFSRYPMFIHKPRSNHELCLSHKQNTNYSISSSHTRKLLLFIRLTSLIELVH